MALEATSLYQQDLFVHNNTNDLYPLLLETCSTTNILPPFFKDEIVPQNQENNNNNNNVYSYDFNFLENQSLEQFDWHYCSDNNYRGISHDNDGIILTNYDIPQVDLCTLNNDHYDHEVGLPMEVVTRPRRRRSKVQKNKEDIENQRMTHIVVERNRRKQMNEYLNVLRSLMPNSYVQRGDQASIVGGAINFVKELEQNLQCLSAKKHIKDNVSKGTSTSSMPFQEFFTFPQYSSISHGCSNDDQMKVGALSHPLGGGNGGDGGDGVAADVEVTMVESHVNLKIRLKWTPKKLSKLVSGLLCLRLSILHLNVNTADGLVFYSFSLKVEDDSKLNTVDEIAEAVYNLLGRIQEDLPTFNC